MAAARICRRPWSRYARGQKSHFILFFCQTQSFLVLPDPEFRTTIIISEALPAAGGVDFPDSSVKWWQPSPLPANEKALPCLNLQQIFFCLQCSLQQHKLPKVVLSVQDLETLPGSEITDGRWARGSLRRCRGQDTSCSSARCPPWERRLPKRPLSSRSSNHRAPD